MPSRAPICALRASRRRISDSDCSGWPTPDTGKRGGPQSPEKRKAGGHSVNLQDLVGWPTPTISDHKAVGPNAILGRQVSLSHAGTGKRGVLNPAFVRWLQGFPAAWDDCADTAIQSSRKSRRHS
jgi:hypothetical protein